MSKRDKIKEQQRKANRERMKLAKQLVNQPGPGGQEQVQQNVMQQMGAELDGRRKQVAALTGIAVALMRRLGAIDETSGDATDFRGKYTLDAGELAIPDVSMSWTQTAVTQYHCMCCNHVVTFDGEDHEATKQWGPGKHCTECEKEKHQESGGWRREVRRNLELSFFPEKKDAPKPPTPAPSPEPKNDKPKIEIASR